MTNQEMDNLTEALMDIVNNALKSTFPHGSTQQQDYVEPLLSTAVEVS
jgi:hypothetical protein